jgi:hypothetical protein
MIAQFEIEDFKIKTTGADGGHKYLSTVVDFKGSSRIMTVIFKNKADERLLENLETLIVKGKLIDEGAKYSLTLLESELIISKYK